MASPDNQSVAVRAALGALGAAERFDLLTEVARRQGAINEMILQRLADEADEYEDDEELGQ